MNTTNETYMRKGAVVSNIALEFYEEKEKRSFVCGVHLLSADETDSVKRKWYIEEGSLDDISFLTEENKPSLFEQFRNKGNKITAYQTNEYKDRLRHRLGNLEDKFFDVLRKTIAFRPVDDVKEFINKYVLSEKEIDVSLLRESIEALNELERTLEKTKQERNVLSEIIDLSGGIEKNIHDKEVIELLILLANYDKAESEIKDLENKIGVNKQKISFTENQLQKISEEIRGGTNILLELKSALKENECSQAIEKLEEKLNGLESQKFSVQKNNESLKKQIDALRLLLALFIKITDVPVSAHDLNSLLEIKAEEEKIEIAQKIKSFVKSQMQNIRTDKVHAEDEAGRIMAEIGEKEKTIKSLEAQNIPFPSQTVALRSAIQEEFKTRGITSNVYILSELLEITDKTWTNAIEGFLNTQRFYLVVEPKYYNIALEVYDRAKKIHSQGIINTRKIPHDTVIDENSLAHFVESENSFAKNFVNYILGKVICCENLGELEHYDCAITKDCMVYRNFVARKINPEIYAKPYIGKDAIARQLKQCQIDMKNLREKHPVLKEKVELLSKIEISESKINFDTLLENLSSPNELEELKNQIEKSKQELDDLKSNPDIIELEQKIKAQEEKQNGFVERQNSLRDEKAKLEVKIHADSEKTESLKNQAQSLKQNLDSVSIEKVSAFSEAQEKYASESKAKSAETISANFSPRLETLKNQFESMKEKMIQKQAKYNSDFIRDFKVGVENILEYRDVFKKIDGVEIVRYEEKIRKAKEDSEEIFRNEFLSKMKEAIESSQYEFKNLQKALKNLSKSARAAKSNRSTA